MWLLMHICCAPCDIYPLRKLREKKFGIVGYFYNPNIHPYMEYKRREDAARNFSDKSSLDVIFSERYEMEAFFQRVAFDVESRCRYCYEIRLDSTARMAKARGFDAFTTSLLYSRHQKHDLIRETAQTVSKRHEIPFFYEDFRIGWKEGVIASKEMGLYRQQYCGCIYSEKERYLRRPEKDISERSV